ncbi:MAG: rod shape-determining protein RodA [Candidatus Pacebacteria bacterium]|nr:rod shape-determining protein RodA [Candidatus Paceibacterota bacterium]
MFRALKIDWYIVGSLIPILIISLLTMNSFTGEGNYAGRQLIWIGVSFLLFFICSFIDFRFLRRTYVIVSLYLFSALALLSLFIVGYVSKGAKSWLNFGLFSIQPVDFVKLVLILLLAKYFSRRHVQIAHIRHIIVSAVYAGILFLLVALQPDFGSAITIFSIWLGMVLISGISKKHLALVFAIGVISFAGLWNFGFKEYQKHRIMNFINPLADIRGSGYNAYQAMITVGSGEVVGKGIGYGTQSRLKFLPEYETDFIFAAFAEEWGFVGVIILFILYIIIIGRIIVWAMRGETNFETLYAMGLAIFFMVHLTINIGMNIGVMPVTGIPVPFMSYGGSHLVTEFIGLGILMGMIRYSRATHREVIKNEFLGV